MQRPNLERGILSGGGYELDPSFLYVWQEYVLCMNLIGGILLSG